MKKIIKTFFLVLIFSSTSCIKPIDILNNGTDNFLVVNATITNQLKTQTVQLSRSFNLESQENNYVSNATVTIKDNEQNVYQFIETSNGIYSSTQPFKAEMTKEYVLKINTSNGKSYISSSEKITGINLIDDLEVESSTNSVGKEGYNIIVKSSSIDSNTKYYRYEYEETYKIIAPKWVTKKIAIVSAVIPFSVEILDDYSIKRYCYKTIYSKSIIQTQTTSLQENNVDYLIKFIDKNEFKVSHRYSILVKQYIQSFEAYTYYKILHKLSSLQGSFTQTQPGLVLGNIHSISDPKDKVIGFFEVTSFSEKRLFFNRRDYYPSLILKYVNDCGNFSPKLVQRRYPGYHSPLIETIQEGRFVYYEKNTNPIAEDGLYNLVLKACGDCRVLATNIKPPFWID